MSKIRNLLIIDDEHDEDAIVNMSDELSVDGFNVQHFVINPKSKKYEMQGTLKINLEIFWQDVKNHLRLYNTHIVACDYTLGDDIDGIIVLSQIKHKLHFKGTNLLFSTKIDTILQEILDSDLSFSEKKDRLKKLIRSNSFDFPTRKEVYDVLKGKIRGTRFEEINLRQEILNWLYAFENHKFNGHPNLQRKTLRQIAEAIEDETKLGIEFQKLFIEQGISTMIELNELPPNE